MSKNIRKSHNVSKLMYHFVLPAKYRRVVIDEKVDQVLEETCVEISKRYPIYFLEIGTDKDHVHFLVQSVPKYSPTQIVRVIKSITAREVFAQCPDVKKKLWVSDTKHTVMKRSACCDILYQNIHFLFILCSLSRQLSGNVSDQGRYASSNSGWFR